MEKLKRIAVSAGEEIIRENNMSRKLFILKKGKVRVYKNYNGAKVTLAVLGPGEIFGELSFFDSKPRSASVEAITDIVFVCIDGQKLSSEIESLPSWVHLVFESVANRFRDIDQKMTALQSLQSFQRKNMSRDSVGVTIFSDLLRMTKILRMLIHENGNFQKKTDIQTELEATMGSSFVTPKGYLNVLYDNGFISYNDY